LPTSAALLLGMPGHWEWLIILVLVLIFFGNRIPGLAKSLGGGIHEFKKGLKEGEGKPGDESKPGSGEDA
jgi:sec-independent protein translocase protein TatA